MSGLDGAPSHSAHFAGIDAELRGRETISLLKIAISLKCDTQRSRGSLKPSDYLPPGLLAGLEGWCPTLRPAQVFWEVLILRSREAASRRMAAAIPFSSFETRPSGRSSG